MSKQLETGDQYSLNDILDDILSHSSHADCVAIIGPSAGYFPDPLFERGVHLIGGTRVLNADAFLDRCRSDRPWSGTTQKYTFVNGETPAYEDLING